MLELSSLLLIGIIGYIYFNEKKVVRNKIPFDIKYKNNE